MFPGTPSDRRGESERLVERGRQFTPSNNVDEIDLKNCCELHTQRETQETNSRTPKKCTVASGVKTWTLDTGEKRARKVGMSFPTKNARGSTSWTSRGLVQDGLKRVSPGWPLWVNVKQPLWEPKFVNMWSRKVVRKWPRHAARQWSKKRVLLTLLPNMWSHDNFKKTNTRN